MKPYQRVLFVACASAVAAVGWRGFQTWKERAIAGDNDFGRDEPASGDTARSIVVEQLKEHDQDETPFVRAFESALERESTLEKRFAYENGLRH